jgi:hypothetical protein
MAPAALRNDRSVRELLDDRGIALPNGLEGASVSRSGCFLTTTLPGDLGDSDLVVFIPAYNRQLSDDGKSLGTLPLLVRDLAEAGAREGVGITVLISDDSREREAALNERALGVALDAVDTVPDIYLVGRQERGITFEEIAEELERNLRSRLPCHGKQPAEAEVEYHLNTLRFLATHHGYGPQRVRGHAMTMGIEQPVMSRDSDMLLINVDAGHLVDPADSGQMKTGFRFVYVDDTREPSVPVRHDPDASFLKHAVRMKVGSTLAEIQQEFPEVQVYRRVKVTKDEGLREFLENPSAPVEFRIEAAEEHLSVSGDTRLISVMDLVWGAPDLNGHSALLNTIISGKRALKSIALPAGTAGLNEGGYPGILVKETTNPTCVEVASSRETRDMIPWLVVDPSVGGKGGLLLQTGARAEDQLKANNEDARLMLAYSGSTFYHCRAQEGRLEDAVETFLSEDIGDMVAAIVRQRCDFLASENRWHFDTDGLFADGKRSSFRSAVIEGELRAQIEYTWSRVENVREVIAREMHRGPPHRAELEKITREIDDRCATSFVEFEERVLDYLVQQARFVESVFTVYPVLMEGFAKARRGGRIFAQKWARSATVTVSSPVASV